MAGTVASGLGTSPGWGNCAVFFVKTGAQTTSYKFNARGSPAMEYSILS